MNHVIDTIHQRRSVRVYRGESIPPDTLRRIIDAGNMAPTGAGQNWRFAAITDAEVLARMSDLAAPRYRQWMEANAPEPFKAVRAQIDEISDDPVFYSAPAVVYVISSSMTADADCPMVCQNMMLAARSLEIGSCWVYFGQLILDDPDIAGMLQLQEDEKVYGPVVFGYPRDGFPEGPAKKDAMILSI